MLGESARMIYVVRDPIDRMLSHYMHNVGGGYDERPIEAALSDPRSSYVTGASYAVDGGLMLMAAHGHDDAAASWREL